MEEGEVHEEVESEDEEDAADHGAGEMLCGVGVFFGEVDGFVPAVVGDDDCAHGGD